VFDLLFRLRLGLCLCQRGGGRHAGRLIAVPLEQLATRSIRMKPNYVMTKIPFLAESPTACLADARLEASVHPLMPVNTEYPIERLVAITALELTGRDLLDLAHRGHLGHLGDQRMIIVDILDCN
jgi:hypothetical protein